jgi:hypothetical protein
MVRLRRAAMIMVVLALALALTAGGASAGAAGGAATVAKKHKKCKKHQKRKKCKKHKKHKQQPQGGIWDSQITLSLTTPTHFAGTVSSQLAACRSQRYVIVYYTDPATLQVLPLSVQRTDGAGHYQFDLPKPAYAGDYMAQVSEEQIRANGAPQVCKFASSASLTVSG